VSSGDLPTAARVERRGGAITIRLEPEEEVIEMPLSAPTLDGFREWAHSEAFPQWGRVSFLDTEIVFDLSPEELETHNKLKESICRTLGALVDELDLGEFYIDGVMLTNDAVGLSTEADDSFVSWATWKARRVHLKEREDAEGQYTEMRGSPDWILEVVSKWSVRADTVTLRDLYFRAGIKEFWLIDARGDEIDFQLLVRRKRGYVTMPAEEGWYRSRVFGRSFRLTRRRNRMGRWQYRLEVKAD
jgi:Uma2 family endonuclease